jgi:hypothetical protein
MWWQANLLAASCRMSLSREFIFAYGQWPIETRAVARRSSAPACVAAASSLLDVVCILPPVERWQLTNDWKPTWPHSLSEMRETVPAVAQSLVKDMDTLDETNGVSTRASRGACGGAFVLWSAVSLVLAPAHAIAEEISDDWRFAAELYGWLPVIGGHTTFPTSGSGIDVDVAKILDHLKMTAMGSFTLQKGRWGAYTDLIYLDIGDSKSQTRNISIGGTPLPASVTTAADFDLKSTIWTLGISYRITASQAATFDVAAGIRLASLKPDLKWEFTGDFGPIVPLPRTGSGGTSTDQWDGIVAVKGRVAFGADRKWMMPYYLDVGTGDSDVTWQALLGLDYAFGWGDLGLAWRYLDYELKSGKPIESLNFNGPAFGATFRW